MYRRVLSLVFVLLLPIPPWVPGPLCLFFLGEGKADQNAANKQVNAVVNEFQELEFSIRLL